MRSGRLRSKPSRQPKGMTYAELARESPLGIQAEGYLRLLNGQYPEGEPVPGQLIKVVK